MITSMERRDEKHYTFGVKSKTRDYTYVVECYFITGENVWDAYCNCKGWTNRMDCWHSKFVKDYAKKNLAKPHLTVMHLTANAGLLACPICKHQSFMIFAWDSSKPYRGAPIKAVCANCGKQYELTGVEI